MESNQDERIISALQKGDEGPFEGFYREEQEKFIAWSKKNWAMTDEEAADLYQDSQMYLYENIISGQLYQLKSSLSTYLYAIAKNHANNKFKKQLTVQNHETKLTEHLRFLRGMEDVSSEKKALATQIVQALEGIKDPCKSILQLFYYSGLSMTAIATRLGYKNDSVVKNQKKRCVEQLRKRYHQSNETSHE